MKTRLLPFRKTPLWLVPVLFALVLSSTGNAQDVAVNPATTKKTSDTKTSSEKLRAIPLQELMMKLQKSYGIYFSYQADALKETMVVYSEGDSKKKTDAPTVLNKVLLPAGLTYETINNVYIIKQAPLLAEPVKSEKDIAPFQFPVTGVVTDNNGPVANVTVTEKGTNNGTTTKADGRFVLDLASSDAVLLVSHVSYRPQEVEVKGQSNISISVVSSSTEMESVVVTALGMTRKQKSLAYSVAQVKSEDLVKAANPNLMKSLDGKVSGVNLVSLSPDPTSSVLVNIRGSSAIPTKTDGNVALKGQPLYVIDGIPVGSQTFTPKDGVDFGNIISQLNPEDIDNITILKGGSAGALYGSEGGNGVVMITTKSGRGGKRGLGVSFNSSATWEQPYNFLDEQQDYGQGERVYEWQYDNTDTWGPKLDGSYTSDYWDVKEQAWKSGAMKSTLENRMKAYLQTGSTITNNIGIRGNYDKGSFRVSLSNMKNNGVMPNTKTNQTSISLNTDYRITDKVKISVTTSYIKTYSPNKANSVGSNSVLNGLLFNMPTNLQPLDDMRNYWLAGYEGIQQNGAIMQDNGLDVGTDNPWWITYEKIHRFGRDNYFGKVQLDWQLNKNFSFLVRSGMENVKENYELRQSWGKTKMAEKFKNGDGQFVTGTNSSLVMNSDAIVTYNNTFNKWSVTASAGANYGYVNNNSIEANAGKLATPALFTIGNAMPGTLTVGSNWGTAQNYSVYGMGTLGWNNQLYLDVTGRNDWQGVLDEQKISYFYPSTSLSWVASETFRMPESINLLKGRLAWADVGQGLARQRSVNTYSYDPTDWGAAKTVSMDASLVDPNIKAQHSVTTEAGIDLWMFNNRLRFDFTYFVKDQKDQISLIPTVEGTGFAGMLTNIGDVRNKGFEWGLSVTPVKTKDFTWDLSASFTHYQATITRLSDKFAPNGYVFGSYDGKTKIKIAEGEEIGNIYEENPILRVKEGQYKGMPLLDSEGGEFQKSGDERDRGKVGNYNPDYIIGLNTTLRYRQFTLNLVGSLRKGGKYVSVNQQYMESNGRAATTLGSGPNHPYWSGGRTAELGGHPWPAEGSSQYEAINNNNDGQRSSEVNDASYAKGVFLNPDYAGEPEDATDKDYIVNGADANNTFYQIPYNSYGDVIWDFAATRSYDATNFKLREVSLAYTLPSSMTKKYKLNNLTLAFIGRNMFQWNKSGRNEDPESAFSGVGTGQGVLRATLPSIRSYGFKLSLDF